MPVCHKIAPRGPKVKRERPGGVHGLCVCGCHREASKGKEKGNGKICEERKGGRRKEKREEERRRRRKGAVDR